MKIRCFFAVFALMAFAACQKEAPAEAPAEINGPRETNYLSVRIGDVPTRATGDFEYGSETENEVKSVRLYFFDAQGNATNCVASGETHVNYFDFTSFNGTPSTETTPSVDDIEKKLDAVVVISTAKGDKLPAMVAAVINVPESVTVDASTVAKLRQNVADYSATTGGFIMTSSAYLTTDGQQDVVILSPSNFKSSAEEATKAPVQIYVERVLAKVRVNAGNPVENEDITLDGGRVLYYTGQTSDKSSVEGKKVYVEFLGWAATATADKSYLVKNLDASWNNAKPLGEWAAWQNTNLYRSYWAKNPEAMAAQYYTYNEIKAKNTSFNATVPVYCQENAEGNQAKTKIIVAAQLVNAEGKPVEISEWMGSRYAGDDIKLAMLVGLQSMGQIFIDGVAIAETDIEFKTAGALEGSYGHEVYVQLTEAAAAKAITAKDGSALTAEVVNETLKGLGAVKYWNDGMTYYFTDIIHYSTYPGVVRNHIYAINISDVKGLGTPVYDPDGTPDPGTDPDPEEIIPESPVDQESYLAAQINILSWRIVEQNVSLGK